MDSISWWVFFLKKWSSWCHGLPGSFFSVNQRLPAAFRQGNPGWAHRTCQDRWPCDGPGHPRLRGFTLGENQPRTGWAKKATNSSGFCLGVGACVAQPKTSQSHFQKWVCLCRASYLFSSKLKGMHCTNSIWFLWIREDNSLSTQ